MKKTMLFVGSVIVLILSAITFIFIPAMAGGVSQDSLVFGKYGNKKIEYKPGTEFANAVSNYTEMYRRQGVELKETDYYYIYNYAFVSAVQAVAYSQAVKKSGWAPSTEAIARQMYPYFTDENGNYSTEIFNSVSEAEKDNLRSELARGLVWSRYSEDLLGSQSEYSGHTLYGLKKSTAEMEFLENMTSTKRSFDMAVFEKSSYPESEVKAYGTENKDKFVKYNLSVITVKDQSKAKSILNQLKNEEITFEDAVSEYSDKAYSGADGKLSSSYGYQVLNILQSEDDAAKIFALEPNGLSEVVQTTAGYSIFHNDLVAEEPDFTDKDVISVVRQYISDNETTKIEDYYIAEAKKLAENAAGKSLENAAQSAGAKYVSVPSFALNYEGSSLIGTLPEEITSLSGAASNENFLQTAFSLKTGDISEPVVVGDSVVVLKLVSEQKDSLTDEQKDNIAKELASIDESVSQSTLLSSSKVENNVADVFFNKIMKNN